METVKEQVGNIVNNLSNNATWEDIEYEILLRKKLDNSQRDIEDNKVYTQTEIKKELLG